MLIQRYLYPTWLKYGISTDSYYIDEISSLGINILASGSNNDDSFNNGSKKRSNIKVNKPEFYFISTVISLIMVIPGVISFFILRYYTYDIVIQLGVSFSLFIVGLVLAIKVSGVISRKRNFKL